MRISSLKVNDVTNPMGYMIGYPVLSWQVDQAEGKYQLAARIQISKDESFTDIVFDSQKRVDINSLAYQVRIDLDSKTRYYWRVEVWDELGFSDISETAWFETGKESEPWEAKWITPAKSKEHPYIAKEIYIPGPIKTARIYVSGLGVYEVEINGKKAGTEYLAPFYNEYHDWVQYQTIDVTELLLEGNNVVGAMLGNGWYKGRFGFIDGMKELYGDKFAFICELEVILENGEFLKWATDDSWLSHPSPILESSIYDGEIYDATKEVENWSSPNGNRSDFLNVELIEPTWGALCERLSPPVEIVKKIKPISLIKTPLGENVIDFGQVLTGWIEFKCDLPLGHEVHIQHGELLQDGNFYNENLRTAKAEYRYVSSGKVRNVRPHFTFYGFRYAKIEGFEEVNLDDFIACVVSSRLDHLGSIKTSNEQVNQLFSNALWSQIGNFLDIPTDCPQRDERMGWTGDAQVFAATASYNMHTPAFYEKYLFDMLINQKKRSGSVPHVIPDILNRISKITGNEETNHGSCVWADAATVIPWVQYIFFGNKLSLNKHYPSMKMWVDYIKTIDEKYCDGKRLWKHGFHFADWLALDNPDKSSSFGGTDPYYVASSYYYYSAKLTAKAAKVLELESDYEYYTGLSNEIKTALQLEYFPEGQLTENTQTAIVLALFMEFVPEGYKNDLIDKLKSKLDSNNVHLTTGFAGTPHLCPTLSDHGLNDYAYTLLLNEDLPSWLYEVSMGATTIWERWNSVLPNGYVSDTGMNSMNHYAYGTIVEWMYKYMCGLQPSENHPGFKHAIIKPHVDRRIEWVESHYCSAAGLYQSSWYWEEHQTTYKVTIPFNARANFILLENGNEVYINGEESRELAELSEILLDPGSYEIVVKK